jgi:hypothetical protein
MEIETGDMGFDPIGGGEGPRPTIDGSIKEDGG